MNHADQRDFFGSLGHDDLDSFGKFVKVQFIVHLGNDFDDIDGGGYKLVYDDFFQHQHLEFPEFFFRWRRQWRRRWRRWQHDGFALGVHRRQLLHKRGRNPLHRKRYKIGRHIHRFGSRSLWGERDGL
jgi:hypothetical protein